MKQLVAVVRLIDGTFSVSEIAFSNMRAIRIGRHERYAQVGFAEAYIRRQTHEFVAFKISYL
jgi:hypothetical protein